MGQREMMKLLNRELEALGTPEALAELERRAESRNMRKGVVSYPKLPPKAAKKNPAYAHWTSDPQYSYEQFFRANPAPEMPKSSRLPVPMNAGPYLPELFQTRISDGFPAEYKNNPGLSSEKALLKLAKDCEEGKAISSFWQEGGQLVCVVRYMNGREVKLTGADCKNFADLRRSRSYPSRGAL